MEMRKNISKKIRLEEDVLKSQFKNIKIKKIKILFLQMTLKMKKIINCKRINQTSHLNKMNYKME